MSLFLTLNVFAFVFLCLCICLSLFEVFFFFVFVLTLFLFIKGWFGDHGPSPAKTFSRYIPSVFHFATPRKLVVWQKCTTPFSFLWTRTISREGILCCLIFNLLVLLPWLGDNSVSVFSLSCKPGPSLADTSCCYWLDGSTRVCRTSSGRDTPCAPGRLFAHLWHIHVVKRHSI